MNVTKTVIVLIAILIVNSNALNSQISTKQYLGGQAWSKEFTEYKVKQYLSTTILELEHKKTEYVYVDALTASASGELTTVTYQCKDQSKSGIFFTFYNNYITQASLPFDLYGHKNLELSKAIEFLELIEKNFRSMKEGNKSSNKDSLYDEVESTTVNDLVFRFDDMIVYIDNYQIVSFLHLIIYR